METKKPINAFLSLTEDQGLSIDINLFLLFLLLMSYLGAATMAAINSLSSFCKVSSTEPIL